ncbi:ferredoxin--NADP(+) reductase [Xanthomonas translucens pv. arrhenatheri]|jgi:ferredoxin--NADP+ reductase|uniref:Ferredoxin--NADP reductase n=3 Tax=Xanthomonas graminis TaxID=3390026 RepID=A0A0K2ZFC1_9XANT|nr:ferredoxin--NADP reductase [Xanthomonas translucens]OAX64675.1 ferredoxin--NADP(+) reductase [Xanthomonas translucens pv. arrhenatheri]UKE60765.1 ferredoxin--NADP reductase [Xanthomonas translucens pv. poae]UKE67211.1 ferredoxin--NADP reductase [Xanthomonas translucens pv. phlei]UKE79145.1 ferredoxin--NADP reductase [Xanthomonas translucens pv. arrhenatheri]CTP83632.1 Ferredoxin-NADP reductase [Xanthomonas translucens pv. arrhenatheri LMG 727]
MSSAFGPETVLDVRHWTDDYFSFTTTRNEGFRFDNGQFVMIGLETETRPLLRAYSIASANWEERLEFFSIKVPDGPLTSRLQHIQPGDSVLVGKKPTGTLLISDLHPGRHLYLLGTGTGLAPWLSVIKDPETYERFDKVILTHGVRFEKDLAYRDYFENQLPQHEFLGETIREKLLYYPAVTREDFRNRGRLTELLESGQMQQTLGLPPLDPDYDRAMICGSPQMLADLRQTLDARGFVASSRIGTPGHYVFERAFVEK